MMIQSCAAVAQPFSTLFSLGLLLMRSSPIKQPCAHSGVLGHQRFDKRHDGIFCGSDAEQDFVMRIIEGEGRTQRIGGIIVYSA